MHPVQPSMKYSKTIPPKEERGNEIFVRSKFGENIAKRRTCLGVEFIAEAGE